MGLGSILQQFKIRKDDIKGAFAMKIKRMLEATCTKCKKTAYHTCRKCKDGKITITKNSKNIEVDCSYCNGTSIGKPNPNARCCSNTKFSASHITNISSAEANSEFERMTGRDAPKHNRSIVDNPVQRKKFFQTYLFNFLRQIIRENKYPTSEARVSVIDYAERVAVRRMNEILDDLSEGET